MNNAPRSFKFFSKLNYFRLGYYDRVNIFLTIKIKNSRGDLSDISAITAIMPEAQVKKSILQLGDNKQI